MATRYLILSGLTVAEVFQHITGNYSKVGEGKGMWGRRGRRGRKKEGDVGKEEGGGGEGGGGEGEGGEGGWEENRGKYKGRAL